MKWSDRPIPKQCESDKNCTSQYLYQYSAINGKYINCQAGGMAVARPTAFKSIF